MAVEPVIAEVLTSNTRQFLFSLTHSRPTPSPSAEVLLVQRDGDASMYLNELHHQRGTELKLHIPMNRSNVPAVMAAQGKEGVMQGMDYPGDGVPMAGCVGYVEKPINPATFLAEI